MDEFKAFSSRELEEYRRKGSELSEPWSLERYRTQHIECPTGTSIHLSVEASRESER